MLTPALLTASHPSPVETKRKRSAPRLARIVAPEPRTRVTEAPKPVSAETRSPPASPLTAATPSAL